MSVSRDALVVLVVTGGLVWLLIALIVAAFIVFGIVPAIWRWACYCAYAAFADKAEKDAIRERERTRVAALDRPS